MRDFPFIGFNSASVFFLVNHPVAKQHNRSRNLAPTNSDGFLLLGFQVGILLKTSGPVSLDGEFSHQIKGVGGDSQQINEPPEVMFHEFTRHRAVSTATRSSC